MTDPKTLCAFLRAVICILAAACSGCSGSESDPSADTLAAGAWPTESLSSEASATKRLLFDSIEAGSLEVTAVEQGFTQDFRGEEFHQRSPSKSRIESGVSLAEWAATPADLDTVGFRQSWNAWLAELGEILSLEVHTWEIQLRPQPTESSPGLTAIETREAVWILGRLADGRLREERLYLIFDLERDSEGVWRISSVRSDAGRTAVAPGPYFHDVTARVLPPGSDQINPQIYTDGGPVLADFDADGDVDLFLPRLHASARLYENDGSGHFEDSTAARGLELNALREGSNSGLFLDVDGDGHLDLLIGLKQRGLLVLRNDGDRFFDATAGQPLAGEGEWESLAAADYDGDGWIDVYMTNYNLIDTDHQPESYVDARDGLANVLLRNLGREEDGRWLFEDATTTAGMGPGRERWSYAAAWADYDRDGDVDLYVANDYGPNSLYRNDGGRFEEVGQEIGAADYGNGMGISWADVDGDLWLDAYVSNMQSFAGNRITRLESFPGTAEERALFRRFSKGNTLLRNRGPDAAGVVTFEDISEISAAKGAFWAWGNLAFDYDADADLDLFVCGGFYTGASAKDT